jgi:hypothetical protein
MKRPALVIAFLITVVIISVAFSAPPEERYKNLKVLPKNTNKKQMDSIMGHFSRSLGFRCNNCHVRQNDPQHTWDFANDSLENKRTARQMFRMTAKINKKNFKSEVAKKGMPLVTCYTCHHGQENPATIPPPPPPPQRPQQPQQQGTPRNDSTRGTGTGI